jgi:hypothetical protein
MYAFKFRKMVKEEKRMGTSHNVLAKSIVMLRV